MFISVSKSGYDRHGSQFTHGYFLMLMSAESAVNANPAGDHPIRGLVRFVRMSQSGAWMVAGLNIKDYKLFLSGSYGSDGLIKTVPDDLFELGVDLPDELRQAWATGGCWNSCGSEAEAMKAWAIEQFRNVIYKG